MSNLIAIYANVSGGDTTGSGCFALLANSPNKLFSNF